MPDKKKKSKRSKAEAVADRVFRHYKRLKHKNDGSGIEFVPTRNCEGCTWSTWPHYHGYEKIVTSNDDWLLLARSHSLTVREVKDIISERRGYDAEDAAGKRENAIRITKESNEVLERHIASLNNDA